MRALTIVAAALIACGAQAALLTNLVPDPGFEAKDAWSLTSWENCEFKSEYVPEAHAGQAAAHLNAIKAGKGDRISAMAISKPFAVSEGREYLLSLWYKTSAGETSPAGVSVLSFKAPFAAAQFKTPQTGYTTLSLPASPNWRLWTFRYRMPAGAVEAVLAPRVNAVGELWVDEVCVVPAEQATVRLDTAGTITKLPDTRRYRGAITDAANDKWALEVYSAASDKPVSTVRGRTFDFQQSVATGQRLQAVLVDSASRSVYAAVELPAPPLVEFDLTYPRYRHSVYASDRREAITGQLLVNASAELLKQATYTVVLLGEGVTNPPTKPTRPVPSTTVRLPLPAALKPGQYAVSVAVNFPGQPQKLREEFALLPPPAAGCHEVTVGPDNQTLVDGKPFFARGFMGGNPEVYGPVVKAGYNVGMTFGDSVESATKFLDGCQPMGLYMVTGLPATYMQKKDPEGLRLAIRQIRNHPALLGYYFPDEPSPSTPGLTPQDFAVYYQIMLQEDPYHPVMTTLCEPELSDEYQDSLDILLYDPYPVLKQRRPLTMVSDWLLRAGELTGHRKPLWFVPEAFGGDVIEGCPESYSYVTPTPEQTRCMVYLGLAAGAQGLLPYCYHVYTKHDAALAEQGKWPWGLGGYLPEKQPKLWEAYAQIGPELQLLSPALGRPSRCWNEQGLFMRELPPVGKEPGYLIAVNPSEEKTVEAVIRLQTRLPQLPELEEIHRSVCCVKVAGSEVTLKLEAMQVGIYLLPGK